MNEVEAVDAVREAAGLPGSDEASRRADTEFGNQLCVGVQHFLKANFSEWDVELFFETYGRPPRDGSSWTKAIIDGLATRDDLQRAGIQHVVEECRARAIAALRAEAAAT